MPLAWTMRCCVHLLLSQAAHGEVVWTPFSLDSGPPARAKMGVALSERVGYLDTQPRLLMFGGCDQTGARNDLWSVDLSVLPLPSIGSESDPSTAGKIDLNPSKSPAWVEVTAAGSAWPAARCEHSLTALADGRVVLFGGTATEDGTQAAMNDLWIYHPDTKFTAVAQPANISTASCDTDGQAWPYRRYGHATAALGAAMWMFGGWISACGQNSVSDELWVFDAGASKWARQPPRSLRPSARTSHNAMAYDSSILVMGGWDGSSPTDDIWTFEPGSQLWAQLHTANSPAEPGPEKRYGATLDPIAGGMVLHGGSNRGSGIGDEFFGDLWVFTFPREVKEISTTTSVRTSYLPHPHKLHNVLLLSHASAQESLSGSGTKTTTTTTKITPVNKNRWMKITDNSFSAAPERCAMPV